MASKSKELADAIVIWINEGGGYVQDFTARRVPSLYIDIKNLTTLQVVVYDGARASTRSTRASYERTWKPVVAVLKKLDSGNETERLAEVDVLTELVEQLEQRLENTTLADLVHESFNEEQDADPFNLESLKQQGCFAASIQLTYMTVS